MALYMNINGIAGDVTESNHQGWIKLNSMQFHLSRDHKIESGCANSRCGSAPVFQDVELTKHLDAASTKLFQHACQGDVLPSVEIQACHAGASMSCYAKYVFHNVMMTHYSPALSTSANETLRLSFTQVETTYTGRDESNRATAPQSAAYDLVQAQIA